MPETKKKGLGNVFFIGLLSFFGGISQDMFVPILPLYLANILGFSKEFIGISEGLVTSGASIFRAVAGFLTDRFGRKKPFIFLGYFFSLIARPLLALTSSFVPVLGLRFLDGIGKGMKDSPKDALIADSTVVSTRGKGFGIARMLDTLGSVAGPLALFGLLFLLRNSQLKYHIILLVTAIPLIFTLIILKFKVEEFAIRKKEEDISEKFSLPKGYYLFLVIMLIFSLGNSSDAFLILRAQNLGVTLLAIPLVYALFNFVYASASVPLGSLSDKIGREKVIILGWAAYAFSYLGFALAKTSYEIWLLFAFYGLYYATTEGVAKAFIADMIAKNKRGRAYGIYNTAIGLITLPASFIAGFLWDKISPSAPFFFGASISILATVLLVIFLYFRNRIDIGYETN
jgi:MFS family permease